MKPGGLATRLALGAGAILLLAALPLLADDYAMHLAITGLIDMMLAMSWNFIGGMAGYPSFGIAAFFGLGAYAGGWLTSQAALPFLAALPLSALLGALVAAVIGAPVLRLRGHYFAVASLAIAEVFREIAMSWTSVTGGGMGMTLPEVALSPGDDLHLIYDVALALSGAALLAAFLISRGSLGVALRCVRQNEAAAAMIGIDTVRIKVAAFAMSAAVAAAAGAVYASWVGYIDPSDVFGLLRSVQAPVMVLIGGFGTVLGPVLGALIYLLFEEAVSHYVLDFQTGMLGIIIVVLILFSPTGLLNLRRARRVSAPR